MIVCSFLWICLRRLLTSWMAAVQVRRNSGTPREFHVSVVSPGAGGGARGADESESETYPSGRTRPPPYPLNAWGTRRLIFR